MWSRTLCGVRGSNTHVIGFAFMFSIYLVNYFRAFRLEALRYQVGTHLPARFAVNFPPEHISLGRPCPTEAASEAVLEREKAFIGGLFFKVRPELLRPVVPLGFRKPDPPFAAANCTGLA